MFKIENEYTHQPKNNNFLFSIHSIQLLNHTVIISKILPDQISRPFISNLLLALILLKTLAFACTFTSFDKTNDYLLIHIWSWTIVNLIHNSSALLILFLNLKFHNSRNTTPKQMILRTTFQTSLILFFLFLSLCRLFLLFFSNLHSLLLLFFSLKYFYFRVYNKMFWVLSRLF